MSEMKDFNSEVHPDWCPGCGDFGLLSAMKKVFPLLNLEAHQIMTVSGIGCSSNLPGFINTYGMHTLHGRALPRRRVDGQQHRFPELRRLALCDWNVHRRQHAVARRRVDGIADHTHDLIGRTAIECTHGLPERLLA